MSTHRVALWLLAIALPACAAVEPPDGFLRVGEDHRQLKAVSDDESLFWYREFGDSEQAGFDFWVRALRNELVEQRGYTVIEEREVTVLSERGAEWLFEVTVGGVARRYLVRMSVAPGIFSDTIRVVEYVADKAHFDRHLDAVRDVSNG